MASSCADEDNDEVPKFEPKVIYALTRLQLGCRLAQCCHNCEGVSCDAIAEFICTRYHFFDGDIETQVRTALHSCVKNGTVCALRNGNYRLIGSATKDMVAVCVSKAVHSPKCCCLALVKCLAKNNVRQCQSCPAPAKKSQEKPEPKINPKSKPKNSNKSFQPKRRKCEEIPAKRKPGQCKEFQVSFSNPNWKKHWATCKKIKRVCGNCGKAIKPDCGS